MIKRIFLMMMVLSLVLSTSCTKKENIDTKDFSETSNVVHGGLLRVSSRKPETFNPLATNYESCRELFYLMYDGLFILKEDFSIQENLAAKITMDKDLRGGKVILKEGIAFSDGSFLGAEDVIYSIDFIKANGGSYSGSIKNIKNIEATGPYSLTFELYTPEANFAYMLTFPIIKEGSSYYMDKPNGTGQYKAENDNLGYTGLLLEKNPSYHLGRAYIDEVKVEYMTTDVKEESSFQSGEIDLIKNPEFSYEEKDFLVYELGSNLFEFLGFNTKNGLFSDEAARKAVVASCQMEAIKKEFDSIKNIARTPINPLAYFSNDEEKAFDNGSAKEILERNGWVMGGSGVYEKENKSMSFSIVVNEDNPERIKIANYISHALLSNGISASVLVLSYDEYKGKLQNGEFEAFIGGCAVGNPSGMSFLLGTGGSANVFGYSGAVMDMRINALATAAGENLSLEAKKFEKVVMESAPLMGLYFKTSKLLAKRNLVIPEISPSGTYITAYKWYFKE